MSSLQCFSGAILCNTFNLGNNITYFFKVTPGLKVRLASGSVDTGIALCFINMLLDTLAGSRAVVFELLCTLELLGDL